MDDSKYFELLGLISGALTAFVMGLILFALLMHGQRKLVILLYYFVKNSLKFEK